MWRIIKFIFTGVWNPHQHLWKIINKGKLLQSGRLVGERYVMQCESCGCIKSQDLW